MEEENYDYVSATIDEIALEGLDGITLSALWLRLQNRPHFALSVDDNTKVFIWNFLSLHPEIEFYELPEPRKPLVLFNRYDYVDLDIGVVFEPATIPEDIYPFKKVEANGLRGSCSTFDTRKNVTKYIRNDESQLMDLQSVMSRWNEKLVLVASQEARNLALLGTEFNPQIKLNILQYCMLERIGRSRYHGEVTQGKTGLSVMNEPVKSLHYLRKLLMQKQIITKQLHYQKTRHGQTSSGGLLHLKRFYMERRSKMQLLLQSMSEKLSQKPNQREVFTKLRSELGVKETVFKKIFQKALHQYVKVYTLRYREMYPNATKEESFVSNGNEKILKIVELIKPYDEAEEEEDDNEKDAEVSNEKFFDPKHFVIDRPLLSQIYTVIMKTGPEGVSAQEIGRKVGLPKLEIRLLCRNLERKKAVGTFMQDIGRQRVTKYVAKKFEKESENYKKIFVETKKLLGLKYQRKSAANSEKFVLNTKNSNEISTLEDSSMHEMEQDENAKKPDSSDEDFMNHLLKDSKYTTHRRLKRAVAIIQMVKDSKLIDDVHKLQKVIYEREVDEGCEGKIDKKSMLRLIHNLDKDGYIRSIRTSVKIGDQIKKLHLVCDPVITEDHPLVKNAIDQAIFKHSATKETFKSQQKAAEKQAKEMNSVDKSIKELQKLCGTTVQAPMQYMPSIGRTYGLEPKFIRMKSLYTFLFYLVYDYQGQYSTNVDGPPVYHVEKGWKMFIPPLPQHNGIPEGWCLISDILLSMPLSILVKVVNITYRIEGLETYLNDPIKQHYLIRYLPDKIRSAIMFRRRYIFAVHDIATKLSFMGLFSFGPQKHKEKDQSFIFVHRRTSIRDTTISKPGYLHVTKGLEYSKTDYFLKTLEDVESYWLDLETVCLHTPLGSYNSARGQSITIEYIYRKPSMIEASRNKKFEEVFDDGKVPGDQLGAAGLESALFSHLKRNWSWPSKCRHLYNNIYTLSEKDSETTKSVNNSYKQYLLQKNNPTAQELPDRRKRLSRLHNLKRSIGETDENIPSTGKRYKKRLRPLDDTSAVPGRRQKPATIIRTINRKYTKKRKPYYDDKDKDALKRMSKLRVDWTTQEDSILLLCKVTSCLLNPHCNGMVVPYSCVRDFLHEKIPNISGNKTSRACQRRVRYMLLNPTTSSNVSVFLTEARQDKDLMMICQEPKPAATNVEVWSRMFITVLNRLLSKFTLSASDRCEKIALPRTLDELHANYQVIVTGELPGHKPRHQHPQSVSDIYEGVVYALIMSSLCSVGDKNGWSYILYKLYQQYPENMLRAVVARIRRDHMVTKKKHIGKRIMKTLPLSSLPYHLSVNYTNTLLTQYQPKIYNQCYDFLEKLVNNTHSKGVEVYKEEIPGCTAGVVALMDNFSLTFELQIPDQIILVDNTLDEKQHSELAKQMEECTVKGTELSENNMESITDTSLPLEEDGPALHTAITSDEPPVKKRRTGETSENGTSGSDHDYACASKTDNTSNSANSNISFECASGTKGSRFALRMLRQSAEDPTEKKVVHHAQDYFVINLCPVFCRLRESAKEQTIFGSFILNSSVVSKIIDSQSKCLPNCMGSFDDVYDLSNFDVSDKVFGREIYNAIYEQKEFGITRKHLWEMFGNSGNEKRLEGHLNYMIEKHLVLRVGIVCFQYVCYDFCKPWILSSYKIPKELKSCTCDEAKHRVVKDVSFSNHEASETKEDLSASFETRSDTVDKVQTLLKDQQVVTTETMKPTHIQPSSIQATSEKQIESSTEMDLPSMDKDVPASHDSKKSCNSLVTNASKDSQPKLESKRIHQSELNKTSQVASQKKQASCTTCERSSSINSENWERVQFVPRSWRKPNGTLNYHVLNDLLSSVLGYIMTFPGKTEQQICNHFIAALQPVQVLELIETLAVALCVRRFYLKSSHAASLFSKPVKYELSYDESANTVCHVEATADAIVKFSQLSEILLNDRTKMLKSLQKVS